MARRKKEPGPKRSRRRCRCPPRIAPGAGFSEDYKQYLDVARSALGSTKEVTRRAKAAGFDAPSKAAARRAFYVTKGYAGDVTKRAMLGRRRRVRLPRGTFSRRAERKHTHMGARKVLPTGEKFERLDFDAPETGVRLLQGYTNVPRLMAAPNHLGCGGAPRL